MQEIPRCFVCEEPIEHDPYYEAPCGQSHEACRSAVFHGTCLMKYREVADQREAVLNQVLASIQQEHCPHGHRRDCAEHICDA